MMRDLLKSHFNAFGLLVFCLILHSCVNTITGNEDKDEETSDDFMSGTIPINIVAESLHKQIYNKNFESYIGLYAY